MLVKLSLLSLVTSIVLARTVKEIEDDLRHGTGPVRIKATGEISPKDFFLWEIAIKDNEAAVRQQAVKIAQQFPPENVLPVIIRYLNDDSPEVASEVEKYLSQQKFSATHIDLLKELSRTNPDVAAKILPIIIRIAPDKVTDLFLSGFVSGNDFVRLALARSLKTLNRDYTRKVLGDYLNDELPEIRLAAARSLIEMQAWPYLPKIVWLLTSHRPEIYSQAKEIIDTCPRTPENAIFWAQALSPDLPIPARILVITAVGDCNNSRVIPILWDYIFDRNHEVREKAVATILRLAGDEERVYFIEKLFRKNRTEREIAINYLSHRKDFSFCLFALKALARERIPELKEQLTEIAVNNADRPFPEISEMLFSPNEAVRRAVLRIIANLRSGMYLDELVKYQRWEKNPQLQKELVETLGVIATPAAVESVNNFLLSKNPEISRQAIAAVEKVGNYTSLNNLLFLLDSKNEEIAAAARPVLDKLIDENSFSYVWTLTQTGVIPLVARIYILEKAKKFLSQISEKEIESFFTSPSDDIVLEALELARLKATVAISARSELLSGVMPLISHRNESVRQGVASFLEQYGDEQTARAVFRRVTEEKNDLARQALLRLLVRFPKEEYFPTILKLFSFEDGLTRQLSLDILLSSPRPDYIPFVTARLTDSETAVRARAVQYLGRLRSPVTLKFLIDFVRQENSPDALAQGLWALGETGVSRKEILDIGMSNLANNNSLVQKAAADMLDKLVTAADTEFLVRALSSSEGSVRQYALKKIAEFKLVSAMPVLSSLLAAKKSDTSGQEEILLAMEKILDWSNIAELEKIYVPDTSKKVRLWILTQVRRFPSPAESRRIILNGLREPDEELRAQAVDASINISDKEIIQQLEYLAKNDPSEIVKSKAVAVLKQRTKP